MWTVIYNKAELRKCAITASVTIMVIGQFRKLCSTSICVLSSRAISSNLGIQRAKRSSNDGEGVILWWKKISRGRYRWNWSIGSLLSTHSSNGKNVIIWRSLNLHSFTALAIDMNPKFCKKVFKILWSNLFHYYSIIWC